MRVIDDNEPTERRWLKALVYGKSGTGKTTFGVSAPRALILLSEKQAVPHIRAAAKRLNRPMPTVLVMESLDDYRAVIKALHADRSKPFVVRNSADDAVLTMNEWPESIVLDSVTDACELISLEIREQSPPKIGKDGLPVDSERYWNVLMDRAQKLIRAFRDVDANVLFLCLLDERTTGEGDDITRWVGPQLPMRKLPGAVMAAVNVVGVTYRQPGKQAGTQEYGIRTHGPNYVELKPFPPLLAHEVTDFTSWCNRINGQDDGQRAPAPADAVDEPKVEAKPVDKPAEKSTAAIAEPDLGPAGKAPATKSTKPTTKNPKTEPADAPAQNAEA